MPAPAVSKFGKTNVNGCYESASPPVIDSYAIAEPHGRNIRPVMTALWSPSRFHPETVANDLTAFTEIVWRSRPRRSVIVWIGDPPSLNGLDVRLMARGFRTCWTPHWMRLDLTKLMDMAVPEGVTITNSVDHRLFNPSFDQRGTSKVARRSPDRVIEFTAWSDGNPVGSSVVFFQRGRNAFAGIYDVGVREAFRHRGIGGALTAAACQAARDHGYRWAGLNATKMGARLYRRLGFVSEGRAQTLELTSSMLAGPRPSPRAVSLVEAIGFGNVGVLRDEFRAASRAE